jgi:hypothetical protein
MRSWRPEIGQHLGDDRIAGRRAKPSSHRLGLRTYQSFVRVQKVATKDYVDALQSPEAGVKVFNYTLDRAEEHENALSLGAYGCVCDEVDEASGWLQDHGA